MLIQIYHKGKLLEHYAEHYTTLGLHKDQLVQVAKSFRCIESVKFHRYQEILEVNLKNTDFRNFMLKFEKMLKVLL